MLSKNAEKLHIALSRVPPKNRRWICEYARMNLGLSIRETQSALEDLERSALVIKRVIRRNRKSTEYLFQYIENLPISEQWLKMQIEAGLADARGFSSWKSTVSREPPGIKAQYVRDFFARINIALGAINLLIALKGTRKRYVSKRNGLLQIYHAAFRWLRRDRDYDFIFPLLRYDLMMHVLYGQMDIIHTSRDLWKVMVNLNPRLGEKMPDEVCRCEHLIQDHEVRSSSSRCEADGCDRNEYKVKLVSPQS